MVDQLMKFNLQGSKKVKTLLNNPNFPIWPKHGTFMLVMPVGDPNGFMHIGYDPLLSIYLPFMMVWYYVFPNHSKLTLLAWPTSHLVDSGLLTLAQHGLSILSSRTSADFLAGTSGRISMSVTSHSLCVSFLASPVPEGMNQCVLILLRYFIRSF